MSLQYNENSKNQYNNQKVWELGQYETAYYLHRNRRGSANRTVYKLNIPTIMPDIPPAKPIQTKHALSKSVFCNDIGCKLPIGDIIITQNYMAIGKYPDRHFCHRWIDHLTKIRVECRNHDIDDIHVVVTVDPSYCDSCMVQHPGCNTIHRCDIDD